MSCWLAAKGVRFAPGGIRKGPGGGFRHLFPAPQGPNEQFPIGG
jgi:hypothetical protein